MLCWSGIQAGPLPVLNHNHNHNVLYAVMSTFGMSSLEDMPSDAHFSDFASKSKQECKQLFEKKIREVIDKHFNFITLEFPSTVTSAQTNAGCTTTSQASESRHTYTTSSQTNTSRHMPHHKLMHQCSLWTTILCYPIQMKYFHLDCFFMEYIDSIKEGDGDRILRCWRYMLLLFKVSNKTKYSVEAYNLLAHYQYLFSERMCKQLLWSRTVNVQVNQAKIYPWTYIWNIWIGT